VSLLGLLSPVVATLVGWLVSHHTLTPAQLAGGALVLLALCIGQRPSHDSAERSAPGTSARAPAPVRPTSPHVPRDVNA
jgi:probable blue pigment (indigoidine) exporter